MNYDYVIDDGVFGIEVDADDYAETAAGDTASTVSRTFQSEEDFQKQKASYTAKIDDGNIYESLITAIPCLREDNVRTADHNDRGEVLHRKLTKREVQLLGYAAGELYFHHDYARLISLCERVQAECELDGKVSDSLLRWMEKCRRRMRQVVGPDGAANGRLVEGPT